MRMKTEHRYTIDGVTYESLDDMPPEVREKWTAMAPALEAMEKLTAAARAGKWTNVRVQQTATQAGAGSADLLTRGLENQYGPQPIPIGSPAATPRTKRAVLFLTALSVTFGLPFLAIFSRVHLTVRYDYRWWAVYDTLLVAAAAAIWKMRRKLQRQPDLPGNTPRSRSFSTALCCFIVAAIFTLCVVFGSAPILAHYATARPGEMTVTVTRKFSHAQRGCTYRLDIREFTFFADDYLCVSARAFDTIQVGSQLRLEGEVSPFGIAASRYSWVPTGN